MDHAEYVAALRAEGDDFARVTPADIDVPTCPGWTLIDLYHHLGSVHRWQLAQLEPGDDTSLRSAPKVELPSESDDLVDWLLSGVDALADRLVAVGPDHQTPTWFGPRGAIFWARRAAHETAVHRWDAQAAVASPRPIDPELAVDGIDELLEVFVPRRLHANAWPDPAATIHVHATDAPDDTGEWTLGLDGSELTVTHDHGKGDAAVRGPASDLLMALAGRLPVARMEVFGDTAVLDRWQSTVNV